MQLLLEAMCLQFMIIVIKSVSASLKIVLIYVDIFLSLPLLASV